MPRIRHGAAPPRGRSKEIGTMAIKKKTKANLGTVAVISRELSEAIKVIQAMTDYGKNDASPELVAEIRQELDAA